MKKLTGKEARMQFPEALKAMNDGKLPTLAQLKRNNFFWLDDRGRLHVDDSLHPAYDDVWNPELGEWEGSDEDYPENIRD